MPGPDWQLATGNWQLAAYQDEIARLEHFAGDFVQFAFFDDDAARFDDFAIADARLKLQQHLELVLEKKKKSKYQ